MQNCFGAYWEHGSSAADDRVAQKDRDELRTLLKGGVQQVRVVLRALALLQFAEKTKAAEISKVVALTPPSLRRASVIVTGRPVSTVLFMKRRDPVRWND